jgi:hypothetical protein
MASASIRISGSHEFEGDAGKPVTLTEFVMEVEDLLLKESLL